MYIPQTDVIEQCALALYQWKDNSNNQIWEFNLWEDENEYKRISVWVNDKKIIRLNRVIEVRKNFLLMKNGKITVVKVMEREKVFVTLNGAHVTLIKHRKR